MPSASAQLLVAVDGGAPASGGQTTANDSATIALSAVSKVGWGNPPARWQICSFPSGYACPAGWSTVTTTIGGQSVTVYQYTGNSDPPGFSLPGGGWWGKLLFRLVVLGGTTSTLVDELCGVEVLSPNGVRDVAFLEAGQFDAARRAVGPLQANLRLLEDALAAGGGASDLTFTAVKTADYTAAVGDLVRVNASGGAVTIASPASASGNPGKRWGVVRVDNPPSAHDVTLTSDDSINDAGSYTMPCAGQAIILRSDGTGWRIESAYQSAEFAPVAAALAAADAAIDVNAQKITNLADPVDAQDAATRAYVLANVGGSGLQTGADIDYAAIGAGTPQDFKAGGDGNYTIAAKTHAVLNSANAAKLALDANGLTGRDSANTSWPVIHLPLTTLAPAVSLARHEAWILARLKLTAGTPGGGTFLRMALDFEAWVAANTANRYMYQQAGYQGGAHYLAIGAVGTVGGEFAVSSSLIASDQVVAWQIMNGGRLVNFYSLAWGGSWPAPDDFAQDATTLLTHSSYAWTPSSATLRLAWDDTTGSSAEWSVPRIQVLYR